MAKSGPKQIYEHGELDRTRKNLGELSPEEAREMAKKLGGEVGLEKDSRSLSQKYTKISQDNRRRTDIPGRVPQPRPGSGPDGAAKSGAPGKSKTVKKNKTRQPGGSPEKPSRQKSKPGYWARIRSNFLAAGKDHNIIPLASALASLLPFLSGKEVINPKFIREGEGYFYAPILNVQSRIRRLLTGSEQLEQLHRPDDFYKSILHVLFDWDTQGIHDELTKLEKGSGSGISLSDGAALCRLIFIPMVRLQNLSMDFDILGAVKHYNELWKKFLGTEKGEEKLNTLRKDQAFLMEELPRLYRRIHYGCYPLLMKLSSAGFFSYREFYAKHKTEYLAFLGLSENDILTVPGKDAPARLETRGAEKTEKDDKEPDLPETPASESDHYKQGIKLLAEMFPQAGFDNLESFPDFYPYFASYLSFPKNFELLPPKDPLHGTTVLMLILKELFFAFGAVKFGSLKSQGWDLPNLRDTFEDYTSYWFKFLEDYLPNLILDRLLDYCRGIEKGKDFEKTDYALKIESDIYWQKRSLFFPYLSIRKTGFPKPPLPSGYRKLSTLTGDLEDIFKTILESSREDSKGGGVENINSPFRFPIESFVSSRFRHTLTRHRLPFKNSELIRGTCQIMGTLNSLISKPGSFWYQSSPWPIYRSTDESSNRPVYNLTPLNTEKLIYESDEKEEKDAAPFEAALVAKDRIAGPEDFTSDLGTFLSNLSNLRVDSAMILLRLAASSKSEELEAVLQDSIRTEGDHFYRLAPGEYALFLEDTSADGAVVTANRILRRFTGAPMSGAGPGEDRLFAAVTPLRNNWLPDEALIRGRSTLEVARKRGETVIVLYDDIRKKYRLFAGSKTGEKGENP